MRLLKELWRLLLRLPPVRELEPEHTAIVMHWPHRHKGQILHDRVFMVSGVLHDEVLHQTLDALIEEHVPATDGSEDVLTEITLFWHYADGRWETEDICSHYYQPHEP